MFTQAESSSRYRLGSQATACISCFTCISTSALSPVKEEIATALQLSLVDYQCRSTTSSPSLLPLKSQVPSKADCVLLTFVWPIFGKVKGVLDLQLIMCEAKLN